MSGVVSIVGAGPGDPKLITVRGMELVRQADVILYDALLDNRLLAEAPEHCEKIYVGKRAGQHMMTQEAINGELVRHARAGKHVVRLKGGDPFIFGRGGEEALAVKGAGISCEVVPGVTSAIAVPAMAGIPVLQRKLAGSVLVLHGRLKPPTPDTHEATTNKEHLEEEGGPENGEHASEDSIRRRAIVIKRHRGRKDRGDEAQLRVRQSAEAIAVGGVFGDPSSDDAGAGAFHQDVDWEAICRAADTLVFLMGFGNMDTIREGLLAGGRPADQPVAIIQWGTTARQRTCVATVEDFPDKVREENLGTPATIVVGEVVTLHDQINFFEKRPLFGATILLAETPDADEAELARLAAELHNAGAEIERVPIIAQAPLAATDEDRMQLLSDLELATHLVFTRPHQVELFVAAVKRSGFTLEKLLAETPVLGWGRETVMALAKAGIASRELNGAPRDPIFRAMFGGDLASARPLIVESENDWWDVQDEIENAGALVSMLTVYGNRADDRAIRQIELSLDRGTAEILLMGTREAATQLARAWGPAEKLPGCFPGALVAAVNEDVARAWLEEGGRIDARPTPGAAEGLVTALHNARSARLVSPA